MITSNHKNFSNNIPTGVQMHTVGSQKRYAANDAYPIGGQSSTKMCKGFGYALCHLSFCTKLVAVWDRQLAYTL